MTNISEKIYLKIKSIWILGVKMVFMPYRFLFIPICHTSTEVSAILLLDWYKENGISTLANMRNAMTKTGSVLERLLSGIVSF